MKQKREDVPSSPGRETVLLVYLFPSTVCRLHVSHPAVHCFLSDLCLKRMGQCALKAVGHTEPSSPDKEECATALRCFTRCSYSFRTLHLRSARIVQASQLLLFSS